MPKEKKISVRHYVHQDSRSTPGSLPRTAEGLVTGYIEPLYVQVIFDKKSTRFKSLVSDDLLLYYEIHPVEYAKVLTAEIAKEEQLIRRSVDYLYQRYENSKDGFDIKGFHHQYRHLSSFVLDVLGKRLLQYTRLHAGKYFPPVRDLVNWNIPGHRCFFLITMLKAIFSDFYERASSEYKVTEMAIRLFFEEYYLYHSDDYTSTSSFPAITVSEWEIGKGKVPERSDFFQTYEGFDFVDIEFGRYFSVLESHRMIDWYENGDLRNDFRKRLEKRNIERSVIDSYLEQINSYFLQ